MKLFVGYLWIQIQILVGMGGLGLIPVCLLDGVDVVAVLGLDAQDLVGIFLGHEEGIKLEPAICADEEERWRRDGYQCRYDKQQQTIAKNEPVGTPRKSSGFSRRRCHGGNEMMKRRLFGFGLIWFGLV